jgi:starch-binding outer membrane protein SusE/F
MTNKLSILLSFSLLLIMFSCKKEENKIYSEGGNAPVLSASATTVSLESGQEANTALLLTWTNPEYRFTTGISSQDVTYTFEMDTLGGNFSSSKKYTNVFSKDLTKTYTVGELNAVLGNDMQLQLNPRRNYTLQLRITSSIGSNLKLISNVVSFTTKPFAPPPKVTPPPSGLLFLVGDATQGGWSNPVPLPSQGFAKINNTFYEITVSLLGGGKHFLFLPVNGDWGNKYAVKNSATQPVEGGEFGYNGGNSTFNGDIPGPLVDGTYKISVDFQLGKYTVVKL